MLRILSFIMSGCWHKWKTIKCEPFEWKGEISSGRCDLYTLQCERCGDIKAVKAKG